MKSDDQGRIQDFKLGVAQMDWKIWKPGGGGGGGGGVLHKYIKNTSIIVTYIENTIHFKYAFYTVFYILSPLTGAHRACALLHFRW